MQNLLHLEFRKLLRQKSYYVCFGIALLMLLLSTLVLTTLVRPFSDDAAARGNLGAHIMLLTPELSAFSTMAGIFAAIYICDDYTRHTVKNIVARGYSRAKIYFSKLITAGAAVTVMYILLAYASFLMVLPDLAMGFEKGGKLLAVLGVQYVVCLVYVAIFVVAGLITGNTGHTILCGIFLPLLVDLILNIVSKNGKWTEYWVSTFSENLQSMYVTTGEMLQCLAFSLVYIVAILTVGFFVHQKKDIK